MLLTKANRKQLPPLYSQEKVEDPTVQVKFFNPCGAGTWYIIEFDGEDTMFGYCDLGMGFPELGYVSLSELKSIKLRFGLGIERDMHFKPQPLSKIKEKVASGITP
jgi:hypothetical protein